MSTRTTVAAGLLTAGLLLAGCSSSSDDGGKSAAAASPSPALSKQDQFLQAIHQANIESWATAAPTDAEIAAYPQQWCDQLAMGHSVGNIFGVRSGLYPSGSNWGTKIADADQVLVLATTAYCPQYRTEVIQELQATGNY